VGCTITFNFTVTDSSSGSALSGATVKVLSSTGSVVATGTTDGSGKVSLVVSGVDSYTYSVADSGYTTGTGNLPPASCGDTTSMPVTLGADTGIVAWGCTNMPVVYHVSESYYGITASINYDYIRKGWCVGGNTTAVGPIPFSFPGGQGCSSVSTDLYLILAGSSAPIINYYYPAFGFCPADPTVYSDHQQSILPTGSPTTTVDCSTKTATYTFTAPSTQTLYPTGTVVTLTFTR
jgi:hypothetical protein